MDGLLFSYFKSIDKTVSLSKYIIEHIFFKSASKTALILKNVTIYSIKKFKKLPKIILFSLNV